MHSLLQVGLGPLGQAMVRDLHARGRGRVLAAVDTAPELVGRSLCELAPGAEPGVSVAGDLQAALADERIDCALVTTSSDLARCAPSLRALLARGMTVVTTCEEALWPWLRHAQLAEELDQHARAHGGRLLGTGINPGFLMDTLVAQVSAVCRSVTSFEAWRIQDATTRRIPFQAKIGASLDDDAFAAKQADGSLRHVGLGESLHLAAAALGLELDEWEESLEPVRAERPLECGLGSIPVGTAAGVRQVALGRAQGAVVARLEFVAAIGQADPHDRVRIVGEPPLDVRIDGGVHGDVATIAIAVNALDALKAAPPGFHTMLSVPPVTYAGVRAAR